ncbi:MAG: dTMP kinase [Desulfomonile tiedjei]|nr:dTMP kinase [Desulfomonile tiedjei]
MKRRFDDTVVAMLKRSPLFIVFEGIDGAGKSTQAKMLADRLAKAGVPVLLTAEPSDSPAGLAIKSMKTRPAVEEEARLFTEDRRHHVKRVIAPALREGRTVVCDRYVYSSVAYQGARGISPEAIISANRDFAIPADITFLIEIPVETALARIASERAGGFSPFELKENLMAVDAIYRVLNDPLIHRIDGVRPTDQIHELVLDVLGTLMEDRQAARLR